MKFQKVFIKEFLKYNFDVRDFNTELLFWCAVDAVD